MWRGAWIAVLSAYAVAGAALYVLGAGAAIGPCLALSAEMNAACQEAFRASLGWPSQLLATPLPGIGLFLVLTMVTVWLSRRRRRAIDEA